MHEEELGFGSKAALTLKVQNMLMDLDICQIHCPCSSLPWRERDESGTGERNHQDLYFMSNVSFLLNF